MTGFTSDGAGTGGAPVLENGKPGVVVFHDWFPLPWLGRVVRGVAGVLTVVSASDVLGHDVNGRDSNWSVLVAGETSTLVVPGCQVRAVWSSDRPVANDEMAEVP